MMKSKKLEPGTEFETKYLSTALDLFKFKSIASKLPGLEEFLHGEGPDMFFENPAIKNVFMRFRRSNYPDINGKHFQQLTTKTRTSKDNNIKRKEPNLKVTSPPEEILRFIKSTGFEFTHSIMKECHVYKFSDATLAYYSVMTEKMLSPDYYIEIEVDEETIHNLTEEQAMDVIKKYESILSPIEGISPKSRLKHSLFEIYRNY